MEKQVCEQLHKNIDYRLDVQDRRLNDHSKRLDTIELTSGKLEERLDSLIKQLEGLNTTMRWFIGLLLGGIVAFFFYAIQQNIFR